MSRRRASFEDAVAKSFDSFFAVKRGEPITVRNVKLDLEPRRYGPNDIKLLRQRMNISQAMFAQLLAVSVKTIQGWEAGVTTAPGMARRLLDEISENPKAWLRRRLEPFAPKPVPRRGRSPSQ
jgi:putative transcriptional regulator